ncbi:MAG TPA: hypothetical protein DEA08_35865 [Planctomycetes bacterium]|nr:hypothetical protein [Planctomycetota bacterium]
MAATTRTSARRTRDSPRRRNSPFSSSRRNFFWISRDISPTSSMKSVPPSATSNTPWRSLVAPVKAPATCPKSSLSSSVSLRAPQLMATKPRSLRPLAKWIARATRSLPVPVSPSISTGASVPPTRAISSRTLRTAAWLPTKAGGRSAPASSRRLRSRFSREIRCFSPAPWT